MPLFVRLPREQAVALDRMVDATGRHKQRLVSELLADQLTVGHVEIAEGVASEEVITLQEAAELLRLPIEVVRASAERGELPGRAFGEEWRFSRSALIRWLAGEQTPGEGPTSERESGDG